jgi:hypothetical protein
VWDKYSQIIYAISVLECDSVHPFEVSGNKSMVCLRSAWHLIFSVLVVTFVSGSVGHNWNVVVIIMCNL